MKKSSHNAQGKEQTVQLDEHLHHNGVPPHAHQLKKTNPPPNEKMSFFITN
ncbi:hypothetical protein [Bacillus pseudomycoides]|uniref:hypothetical protein n=1 Tax=Bacillus pseudomycoides TaxID=64104 RepID=UPI00159BD641|nr:hypothetical protein [Bacillus pseudomycoides]